MRHLCLILYNGKAAALFSLLQKGLPIRWPVGDNLESMLTGLFDISIRYIDERIKTILLDGKPVDDLDSATVEDGSVLALSAAMPGLAGATLRRGGHLAAFRNGITYHPRGEDSSPGSGTVTVKLFNVLIRELGIPMLAKGVPLDGLSLKRVLKDLAEALPGLSSGILMDNDPLSVPDLLSSKILEDIEKADHWLLRITTEPANPT